jgi:hypothetical protein
VAGEDLRERLIPRPWSHFGARHGLARGSHLAQEDSLTRPGDCELQHQIVFVHVPKTAGVSIFRAIRSEVSPEDVLFYNGTQQLDLAGMPRARLHAFKLISGHFQYAALKPYVRPDAIFVAMVRDPIERLVSAYNYRSQPDHPHYHLTKGMSFPAFVRRSAQTMRSQICRQLTSIPEAGPALHCLRQNYTLVGTKERMAAMISALNEITGWTLKVRHDNRLPTIAPFTLDTDTARLLLELTAEDRKLFEAIRGEPDGLLDRRRVRALSETV